ncbi:MAG TPA: GDSL-type esterase/lipase family protein, partial [Gemmataceae bacterium]
MRIRSWFPTFLCLTVLPLTPFRVAAAPPEADSPPVKIITLGDSITKGVRPGVKPEETFAALLEAGLRAKGVAAEVVNVGVGGERTDQAVKRLERDVLSERPRLVTVMYGTNDSYVDRGKTESRLSPGAYRANLVKLVAELRRHGVTPVLMTEPRWAADARPNGAGENPNVRLEKFVALCRDVAREQKVPLVDHFARWSDAEKEGVNLRDWTTDGCHPNPRGHREIAETMLPVVLEALGGKAEELDFDIKLETVLKHDDGKFLWFHPRVAPVPGGGKEDKPAIVMTLQKHLRTSDHYSGLSVMRTDDLGKTWSAPDARPELDWRREPGGVNVAVADVTPGWHAATGKVIAIGAEVRYSPAGEQLEDKPRAHQTAYAVFDPKAGKWSGWKRLAMPEGEEFNFARSACSQFVVKPDGKLLVPFYHGRNAKEPWAITVFECSFDGEELKPVKRGNTLSLQVARGFAEPSLAFFGGRYYLTIRNDEKGYV